MIKLRDLLMEILCEKMSFRQILGKSDPKRIARADDVSAKSLGVRGTDMGEAWNFSYKSSNSTTGQRHRGKIEFNKKDISKYDNLMDAPCVIDCTCPDFRYKFAFFNNKANITPIGSTAINSNDGQRPRLPDAGIGACKHIISLSEYLRTSIDAPQEPEQPAQVPQQPKQSPVTPKKEPTIPDKTTSVAPSPEEPHVTEPIKKEIPRNPTIPNKKTQEPKLNNKIGDTYSDTDKEELKETTGNSLSQKIDLFVKYHPTFEVKY